MLNAESQGVDIDFSELTFSGRSILAGSGTVLGCPGPAGVPAYYGAYTAVGIYAPAVYGHNAALGVYGPSYGFLGLYGVYSLCPPYYA
jgi:hypothetical protein